MDADLRSIQEARDLVARAAQAQRAFATASQEQVDRVVGAMAAAASRAAEPLARLAVDETRMGVYEHKVIKNRFASDLLLEYILPMRTVGVLREDPVRRVRELAVPMGVVGAIVPTTNPTSTAIYKALISVKARNAIVMSPHPRAVRCTVEAGRLLEEAACSAGAPPGLVNVMTTPSLEGTNALMRHRDTAVLLATGGSDMVKAVYTAGKPAYGVGPGNVPSIIERTADLAKAVADVVDGKTFDAGVLCSSENSVVVDAPVAARVRALFAAERAHFCSAGEKQALERFMIPPTGKDQSRRRGAVARGDRPACRLRGASAHKAPHRRARARGTGRSAVSREALPGPRLLRGGWVGAMLRARHRAAAIRRHRAFVRHPLAGSHRHRAILPGEAGLPHHRELQHRHRCRGLHDGIRPGVDLGARLVGWQHHVGQHHAHAPPQHQAHG
ncbi:MAG: aldehyde dehydrogenase family protein [Gemmatimonadetes bacterium]|nr:aldehyde dehydrogenase family protein [Gemmatimonadota bacterium]